MAMHRFPAILLPAAWLAATPASMAQELRGFWVDAFNNGMKTASQVTATIEDARRANANALFVQIRKRGDAYYSNGLEPRASDITVSSFDPLADLIAKAKSGPEPLQVHAWIVTYNIWNLRTTAPTQAAHPYNLHPDWLTRRNDGTTWDGANYAFDPGVPAVQQHTFAVCMDIVSRYQVDGLHFDYVRYTDADATVGSNPWGYHPVSVQRFLTLTGRTGTPAANDPAWLQFRRDQVTDLVRKVYLHAWRLRPSLCLSAATISFGSAPSSSSLSAWQQRDAFGRVLQDWRGWLQEGIVDLAIPMVYRDNAIAARATEWTAWNAWARDNQFNRRIAAGQGNYLNTVENTLVQLQSARATSPAGRSLAGSVCYSYGTWGRRQNADTTYSSNYVPRGEFLDALSDPVTAQAYGSTALYPTPVAVPAMPWKADVSRGHLMGFVRLADGGAPLDGATVTLTGPQSATRTLRTDATGFFGALDLTPGSWTVAAAGPGLRPQARAVAVTGATVADRSLWLSPEPFAVAAAAWDAAQRRLTLTWHSVPERTYRVEGSPDLTAWTADASGLASQGTLTSWTSPAEAPGAARRFFRIVEEP